MHNRRTLIASAALTALLAGCKAKVEPATADEISLGDPNAPVKVVEYASVACPVCATYNNEHWKDFKAKFIDTGKVYFTVREMLTYNPNLAAAGFITARCAGADKYYDVLDDIYHARDAIEGSGQYLEGLSTIAKANGLSGAQFEACTKDDKAVVAVRGRFERYFDQGHRSTPEFVVNGERVESLPSIAEWETIIARAATKPAAAPAPAPASAPAAPATK